MTLEVKLFSEALCECEITSYFAFKCLFWLWDCLRLKLQPCLTCVPAVLVTVVHCEQLRAQAALNFSWIIEPALPRAYTELSVYRPYLIPVPITWNGPTNPLTHIFLKIGMSLISVEVFTNSSLKFYVPFRILSICSEKCREISRKNEWNY